MSISKIKTGIKQATSMKSLPRVFMNIAIGFVIGVIADLVLEAIVWHTKNSVGWGRLEVGFPFYYAEPSVTSIAYDDLILLIITVIMLFTKRLWLVVGFGLGWYVSSNEDLYSALGLPKA